MRAFRQIIWYVQSQCQRNHAVFGKSPLNGLISVFQNFTNSSHETLNSQILTLLSALNGLALSLVLDRRGLSLLNVAFLEELKLNANLHKMFGQFCNHCMCFFGIRLLEIKDNLS